MVSTSRNRSCKIFFYLGEIVFFYSRFFASGAFLKPYGGQVLTENFIALSRNYFAASEKEFFPFVKYSSTSFPCTRLDVPGCENSFSVRWKRIFE